MLDAVTKRRIDTARDILVGKVPDPKSQVEQITIALIYKFMDDIDAESEELGGKRQFFADGFARYGWAKLMQPGLGGHETLNLYAEAISRMPENPGIPPLFRDIFNNAYLPYRDPETLRAFLKEINEFSYDHSERLGDAFEYLLSVLGSQGDAGQFRTPRHIIDFIVAVVDPKKDEVVLDPACGTAGFLISSYKHILAANANDDGSSTLTPDERGRLAHNFKGYDISPDMVRLSLVNMYLHDFVAPQIYEYDTLTSDERWNEYADVILANPPFMSPKGGIRPHNRFSVKSKRSEVLFVDYMAEHLTPTGRAGIIVPEGIIFQSQNAYKQLRKMLIEESLIGVISLPSGVFQPYTGVKTSILVLDKVLAKHNPNVLFSDVKHIGFSLGVRRTPIEENHLPQVLRDFRAYYEGCSLSQQSWMATRKQILANDCILTGSLYRIRSVIGDRRMVKVGDVCKMTKGSSSSTKTQPGQFPLILTAAQPKSSLEYQFEQPAVCVPLISSTGHGKAALHRIHFGIRRFALANLLVALQPARDDELDVRFLYHVLDARRPEIAALMQGAANVSMKPADLAQFQFPLPPLEAQQEIVAEIAGYQQVIDGARAVVENYRPRVAVDPEWPLVALGDVCLLNPRFNERSKLDAGLRVSFVPMADLNEYQMGFQPRREKTLSAISSSHSFFEEDDVLLAKVTPCFENGKAGVARGLTNGIGFGSSEFYVLRHGENILPEWVFFSVTHPHFRDSAKTQMTGTGGLQRVPRRFVKAFQIPLPPQDIQREIVEEMEAEQAIVNANRQLVERMEKKIQAVIGRVWG